MAITATAQSATAPTTKRHAALSGEGENLASPIKYTAKERGGVHVQKRRLAARSKIGSDWDGTAANDNIAWPLATALIREGNMELLKAAMYYRKVHDTAKSEAKLGGTSVRIDDGMAIDRHSVLKADGKIAYRRVRQSTAADADIPSRRRFDASTADDANEGQSNWSSVPKPWNGDEPVNNMIDAQGRLSELRSRLGILVEPMEMSVVDGATYREVGNAAGIANKAGSEGAGRALVHTALVSLRDMIGKVKRSDLAA